VISKENISEALLN